jgi:hypothetical protein
MAVNEEESARYTDIVLLVNRTETQHEFKHNSRLYTIPAKGSRSLPRFIAEHACASMATAYGENGFPTGSFLGIETIGDDGAKKEDGMWPTSPISAEEVAAIENSDKFGNEVEVDGKLVTKQRVKVHGNTKKTYQENNL